MGRLAHELRGAVDLLQAEVGATLEEHEHAVGAVDRGFQQRRGDGALDGAQRAILAGGRTDTHEGRTGVLHDRLDVVEVHVDEAGGGDQFGDALDTREEHLVGSTESVEHGDVRVRDLQETIVRDDDQGVDLFAQGRHAALSLSRTTVALEREGTGHNADRQSASIAGDLGDNGGGTGTGATSLTGGHEHHVRTLERGGDLVDVILRSLTTDGRIRAGAQAVRQFATDVELGLGIGHEQSLRVSVDGNELNALEADLDHSVHGVNSAAADADDLDHCQVVLRCRHGCLPCIRPSTSS